MIILQVSVEWLSSWGYIRCVFIANFIKEFTKFVRNYFLIISNIAIDLERFRNSTQSIVSPNSCVQYTPRFFGVIFVFSELSGIIILFACSRQSIISISVLNKILIRLTFFCIDLPRHFLYIIRFVRDDFSNAGVIQGGRSIFL